MPEGHAGSNLTLGKLPGGPYHEVDSLHGVAAIFDVPSDIEPVLVVEATERGWWSSAPLPERKLIVTYMTDADLLPPGSSRQNHWSEALAKTVETKARALDHSVSSQLRTQVARSAIRQAISGPGWLATGDAATCYDPISGSGIMKALHFGLRAGDAVCRNFSGDSDALRKYDHEVWRAFIGYIGARHETYSAEQRWPNAAFWRRRLTGKSNGSLFENIGS